MHIIAKNIKRLRQERNWTQQEMADMLFVTRQTVSNWENGKALPDVETLLQIAEKLDIDVNELVYGKRKADEQLKTDTLYSVERIGCLFAIRYFLKYIHNNYLINNYYMSASIVNYFIMRPLICFSIGVFIVQLLKLTGVIRYTKGIKDIAVFKKALIGMLVFCAASCFDAIRLEILLFMYHLRIGPFVNATGFQSSDWALNLPVWIEKLFNIPDLILCSGSTFYRPPYYRLIILLGVAYEISKPYNPMRKSLSEEEPQ